MAFVWISARNGHRLTFYGKIWIFFFLHLDLVDGFTNHVITRACCGSSHSVALNEWGNVFTWGSNSFSQLGFSTDDSEPMPKLVKALGTKHIVQIAAGNHHNIALTNGMCNL